MNRFYGFDLGDAESAVAVLKTEDTAPPKILEVAGAKSFITAYARSSSAGALTIGENACYVTDAAVRGLRFKGRFLTDRGSEADIRSFAAGVLTDLIAAGNLIPGDTQSCFYIGCPAGWTKSDRERYRRIFEDAGYPPARIVSESRAALISACQSKHLQIGYDILSKPVLVVDIGSSTTDFAYILSGSEVELKTAGEVALGGGIMDELLLEAALGESKSEARIRALFQKNPAWRTYSEFAARRIKETYFTDEEYWNREGCTRTLRLGGGMPLRLTLKMNKELARRLTEESAEQLHGRSFHEVFTKSLQEVRDGIHSDMPQLLFLTGGLSKMRAVRDWCEEVFPEAVVITGKEPEFSVARGLSWSGRIDQNVRDFRREVKEIIDSDAVENIVILHIDELYRSAVETLVEPILRSAVLPVFDRWRDGSIARLSDVDTEMRREIEVWLKSNQAQEYLVSPVASWLRTVAYQVEELTMPLCVKYNVPYKSLSLTSYLAISEIDIHIDARDVFAVEEMTWMINTIITILVGLLCGGSGVALISSGISGIAAGSLLSLVLLIMGKDKMQEVLMNTDVPKYLRRLVPRAHFENRLRKVAKEVRESFYESLEKEKNEEITDRMVAEISAQIEQCLSKMAEVVEIPLG